MDKQKLPKPVAWAIAGAFALLLASAFWFGLNQPWKRDRQYWNDVERLRQSEGEMGPKGEKIAAPPPASDNAYQPEK